MFESPGELYVFLDPRGGTMTYDAEVKRPRRHMSWHRGLLALFDMAPTWHPAPGCQKAAGFFLGGGFSHVLAHSLFLFSSPLIESHQMTYLTMETDLVHRSARARYPLSPSEFLRFDLVYITCIVQS